MSPLDDRFRRVPNSLRHLFHRSAPVDNPDAVRVFGSQTQIRVPHSLVKLRSLLLHPVRRVSGARPPQSSLQVDINAEREVRLKSVAGDIVQRHHDVGTQPAPFALIRERRIREPVGQDNGARFPGRQNHLVEVLCAGGKVQEHLRGGAKLEIFRAQENAPDLNADLGSSRFLRLYDIVAGRLQAVSQKHHLCCLAGPVRSLERNEAPSPLRHQSYT
jgi:hypothetical protein